MKITECRSLETLETLRDEWELLVASSHSATLFSTWEWAATFWRYSAPRRKPVILLARNERDRLVGVLPLAHSRRLGLVPVLEVLGCNERGYPAADYGGLLAESGSENAVWSAMLRHLNKKPWAIIDLRNCPVPAPGQEVALGNLYRRGADELGLRAVIQESAACRRLPLPATFDQYLREQSSNLRSNTRRKLRKLEELGFTVDQVTTADEAAFSEAFSALVRYHQDRWAKDSSGGCFPDRRNKELHLHIARTLDRKGALDLRTVRDSEKRILGVIYNFRRAGVTYFYGLGINQDEEYASLSLGHCLLVSSISAAIEAGCHTFDLMRGDHEYKRRFGGYVVSNLRVTIYHYSWLPGVEAIARGLLGRLRRPSATPLEPAAAPQQ
jgi:CelD/BcsL family acetyltransferase involved in cellulose biosynthesis